MTHGHELKGRNVGGRGCAGQRGVKWGKCDNCNNIINKIYLKNNKKFKKQKTPTFLTPFFVTRKLGTAKILLISRIYKLLKKKSI